MQQVLHRSSLVPRGFVVESAYYEGDKAVIAVRASGSVGLCPSCGTVQHAECWDQYGPRCSGPPGCRDGLSTNRLAKGSS